MIKIRQRHAPHYNHPAMSSGIYAPLPFSLSGTIIDPLFFTSRRPWAQRQQLTGHSSIVDSSVSSSAQDATAAMVSEPLQLAVQSMLSQRSVLIGHHYAELGPRAPGVNGSIALARIFGMFLGE